MKKNKFFSAIIILTILFILPIKQAMADLPDVHDGAPPVGSSEEMQATQDLNTRLAVYPWTQNLPFFSSHFDIKFTYQHSGQLTINIIIHASTGTFEYANYKVEAVDWLKNQGMPASQEAQLIISSDIVTPVKTPVASPVKLYVPLTESSPTPQPTASGSSALATIVYIVVGVGLIAAGFVLRKKIAAPSK